MTSGPPENQGAEDCFEAQREERMHKQVEKMEDGRVIIYYTFTRTVEPEKEA